MIQTNIIGFSRSFKRNFKMRNFQNFRNKQSFSSSHVDQGTRFEQATQTCLKRIGCIVELQGGFL